MDIRQKRADLIKQLIATIEDAERPGLKDTPMRVAKNVRGNF